LVSSLVARTGVPPSIANGPDAGASLPGVETGLPLASAPFASSAADAKPVTLARNSRRSTGPPVSADFGPLFLRLFLLFMERHLPFLLYSILAVLTVSTNRQILRAAPRNHIRRFAPLRGRLRAPHQLTSLSIKGSHSSITYHLPLASLRHSRVETHPPDDRRRDRPAP